MSLLRTPFRFPRLPYSTAAGRISRLPASRLAWISAGLAFTGIGISALWLPGPLFTESQTNAPSAVAKLARKVSGEEVGKHDSQNSGWVVIDDKVYDVTDFLISHPGGQGAVLPHLGADISALFNLLHSRGTLEKISSQITLIGPLDTNTSIKQVNTAEDTAAVAERRALLPPPELVVNLAEFQTLAEEVLGTESIPFRYISSYSDDGTTFDSTRKSFSFLRFIPRVNVPVANISTSTTFLGQLTPLPIFMCPTGSTRTSHPDGEFNHIRAAARIGISVGVSNAASISAAEILDERDHLESTTGNRAKVWWQIYIRTDRKESERQVKEVVRKGVDAILITVDVPAIGNREVDTVKIVNTGNKVKRTGGVGGTGSQLFDANLHWNDIHWIQGLAPGLPVLVKGVTSVADIRLAKQHGAAGVIISNHGGRQLDGAPPPLATLVHLRRQAPELLKDPTFEVYVDGGVTRGTDVLKALCLGAKGVGIGRSFFYAHSCYGDEGIVRAAEILSTEINLGMKLLGATKVEELTPQMLELMPGLVGEPL